MFRFFETRIDPFRAHDESMPPASLFGYLLALLPAGLAVARRADGGRPGRLADRGVDPALRRRARRHVALDEPGPICCATTAASSWPWGCSFSSAVRSRTSRTISSTQQAIAPGMTNLIRWQTHRYVLRQSLSYFANDFAGRIASNIMQAARVAARFGGAGHRRALVRRRLRHQRAGHLRRRPIGGWPVRWRCGSRSMSATLAYFVPRIRRRSEELAHMRATLTGRIVDSYANIQTVKLFAHLEREDDHAREALADHTAAFHRADAADHVAESDRLDQQQPAARRGRRRSPSGSGREAR